MKARFTPGEELACLLEELTLECKKELSFYVSLLCGYELNLLLLKLFT
jgi:hypothetical protein